MEVVLRKPRESRELRGIEFLLEMRLDMVRDAKNTFNPRFVTRHAAELTPGFPPSLDGACSRRSFSTGFGTISGGAPSERTGMTRLRVDPSDWVSNAAIKGAWYLVAMLLA